LIIVEALMEVKAWECPLKEARSLALNIMSNLAYHLGLTAIKKSKGTVKKIVLQSLARNRDT
jgi:hypothetical protein